jgi:5-methylcytosine-specific restriction protein A
MPTAQEFRSALLERFKAAERDGRNAVVVNTGDLHRQIGGYPSPSPRMPICCSVMRQEQKEGDEVVSAKNSDGAAFAIKYRLPR